MLTLVVTNYLQSSVLTLEFLNSPIFLFNRSSNEILSFTCKSVAVKIHKKGFSNVALLKTDNKNSKFNDWLFIPLSSVHEINLSSFKKVSNSSELNEQFDNIKSKWGAIDCGFAIPLKYLELTSFDDRYNLIDLLNSIWYWNQDEYFIK